MGRYPLLFGNSFKFRAKCNRYTLIPRVKFIAPSHDIYPTSGRYASVFAYSQSKTSKTIPRRKLVGSNSSTSIKVLSKEHIQTYTDLAKSQDSIIKSSSTTLPKPTEPDNCCMGGCVNCVWDRYHEEVEEWMRAKNKTNAISEHTLSSTGELSTKYETEKHENMAFHVHQSETHAKSSVEVDLASEDKANCLPDGVKESAKVTP